MLSLPRCGRLGDAAAQAVGRLLPRLRVANCSDWSALGDGGVAALALGCSGLEDVALDGCLRVRGGAGVAGNGEGRGGEGRGERRRERERGA